MADDDLDQSIQDQLLSQTMTHEPDQPSPAEPYRQAFLEYIRPKYLDADPPVDPNASMFDRLTSLINSNAAQIALGTAKVPSEHIQKLKDLVARGLSNSQIAQETGISPGNVGARITRYGLTRNPQRWTPNNPANPADIRRVYLSSLTRQMNTETDPVLRGIAQREREMIQERAVPQQATPESTVNNASIRSRAPMPGTVDPETENAIMNYLKSIGGI